MTPAMPPPDPLTDAALADLLGEAVDRHHQVHADSQGVDPDWPLWYAGFLQARV